MDFDPNTAASADSGIFGLPFTPEQSNIVLLPVPWEATTSYGGGTSDGPAAILEASKQVDLYDRELGLFCNEGIALLPEPKEVRKWNDQARKLAKKIIANGGVDASTRNDADRVNALSEKMNAYVYETARTWLEQGKIAGVVGGDHSTPFGLIKACAEKVPDLGILHVDAHSDTRRAYEGFEYSHASIMNNVVRKIPGVTKLVQVGVRDFCEEEMEFVGGSGNKIEVFFDEDLAAQKLAGKPWSQLCEAIVAKLPQSIYISFDIDALDPALCPHTGTPVPGGLSFNEALLLLKTVVKSGRRIVGFDLNEVAPGKEDVWDANVGARLLFKLCGWTLQSRKK